MIKNNNREETLNIRDDTVSNYKSSLEYLTSIYRSEKLRYNNFNVRLNWILVFLGVLMTPLKFFWPESLGCSFKNVIYYCCLFLVIVLLVSGSILCLYTMVPKTKFEETDCDSFIGEKFEKFVHGDQQVFYKTLIEQMVPKAKLYYKENERKAKYIKIIYFFAAIIVALYFVLFIIKLA